MARDTLTTPLVAVTTPSWALFGHRPMPGSGCWGDGRGGARGARAERRWLPGVEGGVERLEQLVEVLLPGAVEAFAVVRIGAGWVLYDGSESQEAPHVGLQQGHADTEAFSELGSAGGAVEDQRPKDGDPDAVTENVDGSFHVVGEVGTDGARHGAIVVGLSRTLVVLIG
jgi:hypothetical protein